MATTLEHDKIDPEKASHQGDEEFIQDCQQASATLQAWKKEWKVYMTNTRTYKKRFDAIQKRADEEAACDAD